MTYRLGPILPDPAPLFLGGLTLRVLQFETQQRAELHQQLPGRSPAGQLVWQHHRPVQASPGGELSVLCDMLTTTAAWFETHAWSGVSFQHL